LFSGFSFSNVFIYLLALFVTIDQSRTVGGFDISGEWTISPTENDKMLGMTRLEPIVALEDFRRK
jgi:hypothetical protein